MPRIREFLADLDRMLVDARDRAVKICATPAQAEVVRSEFDAARLQLARKARALLKRDDVPASLRLLAGDAS